MDKEPNLGENPDLEEVVENANELKTFVIGFVQSVKKQ